MKLATAAALAVLARLRPTAAPVRTEAELIRAAQAGDSRAMGELCTMYRGFVYQQARRWWRREAGEAQLDDLVQEATLGFMQGVRKFDPGRGVKLISYCVHWTRAYLQNHVVKDWSLVKVGTTQAQKKLFCGLARARRELGDNATIEELAERLDVRPDEVVEMDQRLSARDASLDAPIGDDGGASFVECLPSGGPSPEEQAADSEEADQRRDRVQWALKCLSPKERAAVTRIMGDDVKTLVQVGRELGKSGEWVRQLEERAKRKLAKLLGEQEHAA